MSGTTPPTIYFLYGDHEIAFSEFIHRLREKMGDPSTADMNIDVFSSSNLDLGKLEEVCTSLPFLAPRRLVILEQPLRNLMDSPRKDRFLLLLNAIPQTTALLVIENVDLKSAKGKTPKLINQFIQWLEENQPTSYVNRFELPQGPRFIQWVQQRALELGGQIEPQAAHLLSEFVNEDPHTAIQELSKLLDYVNRDRPIEIEDIEKLTPLQPQSDVFAMVDAIGLRNGSQALQWLRQLLQDDSPLYAFAMIVRQFRLLLLTKDAQTNRLDPREALDVHPYVARKIIAQAKNFSLDDLESIFHRLKEIDVASKTGQDTLDVSLERFVANLTK
jgi:DNA polymerase-3 subunit delta